jgi:hypothetical protein
MSDAEPTDRLPQPSPKRGASAEGVRAWMDLMEACEQLLLAGLRHRVGPGGDLAAAWRARSARRMEQRDREIAHMLAPDRRPGTGHAV